MRKAIATALLLAALIVLAVLSYSNGQTSVENVQTSATITVQPDVIEGQPFTVTVHLFPLPPTGEHFENISVTLISPLQGSNNNGPIMKGPVTSEDGIATFTFNVPTFSAYWNLDFFFPGQYFANNTIYYQRGDWQKNFYIEPSATPTPSPTLSTSPTASPTASPSPTVPELSWLVIVPLLFYVLSVALIVRHRNRSRKFDLA